MIVPSEMAHLEIRITGREIFPVAVLFFKIRLAIKKSKFNSVRKVSIFAKYSQLTLAVVLMPFWILAQLKQPNNLLVGAGRPGAYLPLLYQKRVAVVANQTSLVNGVHLVDFLFENNVQLAKVFVPEHGFRGEASAGESIENSKDDKTGLPIISLYGSNKKPSAAQLSDIEVVVFDIQDVGTRFYTYISTLTYVMEACAENNKKLVVLDRPNPNGYYVDGPVLKSNYKSFVGMYPVPVVHGMTVGEYARMVNGERWLKGGKRCALDIVKCMGWDHNYDYELPVKPSPSLPRKWAVSLYPSLCFFEGTTVSVGRGTDKPFERIGAPFFTEASDTFVPRSIPGTMNPPYEGKICYGFDLTNFARFYIHGLGKLYLIWLIESYKMSPDKNNFFNDFFDKLAGTDQLRKDIIAGKSPQAIRASWQDDLTTYKQIRQKYLLYNDFD